MSNYKKDIILKKSKLIFILPNLLGGGAEKVMLNLISGLGVDKYIVILILLNNQSFYKIPQNVKKVYDLNKKSPWSFPFLAIKMLNIFYKESPDIIFSVLEDSHFVTYFAKKLYLKKTHWLIGERNVQSHIVGMQNFSKIKNIIAKKAYSSASRILAVAESVKEDLVSYYGVDDEKITVIYNGLRLDEIRMHSREKVEHPWFNDSIPIIISVGRCEEQKGQEFLIKGFSEVIKDMECKLVIIGDGQKKGYLKILAGDLGISDNVVFLPFQRNPWKYMAKAAIFVSSSIIEGLPSVILEAMVCGVPVIATECGGVPEIVKNRETGVLVPTRDPSAFSKSIKSILKEEELRKKLIKNAMIYVKDFDFTKMICKYENVFEMLSEK